MNAKALSSRSGVSARGQEARRNSWCIDTGSCWSLAKPRTNQSAFVSVAGAREPVTAAQRGWHAAVREVSDPTVVAAFRLAIAEAVHAPEVAQALDSIGRETARGALRAIMTEAIACGLLEGRPVELTEQFSALHWGDLMMSLLLGLVPQPNAREIARRARDATTAFLRKA